MIFEIVHLSPFIFQRELFFEVSYSDPSDSKLYTEPGADPAGDDLIYKLYVGGGLGVGGGDYYYCRPYGNAYQAIAVKGGVGKSGEEHRYFIFVYCMSRGN